MTLYETTLNIFFCIILKNEFSRIARNFDNNTESCVADIKTHSAEELKQLISVKGETKQLWYKIESKYSEFNFPSELRKNTLLNK